MWDRLLVDCNLATMDPAVPGAFGMIENGAIGIQDGRIVRVGRRTELAGYQAKRVEPLHGAWITPGLVDCHTNLVFGVNRAGEFEQRLEGASYEEIARAGGGIASSVAMLRTADDNALLAETLPRLDALIAEGVTTIEVKSGYGLDLANERKSLRVARQLGEQRPVRVQTTFLGAHALPPEANGDKSVYIDKVVSVMLPAIAKEGLSDAVDGFCEGVAFSPDEISRVFTAAQQHGLPLKLHADQLSDLGGAALAARFGALSADHLEYASEEGAAAMAASGTIAVMLPGAFYFLRESRKPPIDAFRRHGVPMAVATDSNPGTSPLTSLLLAMNMAATLFGLTVEECLAGVTRVAARALGIGDETGTLETGKWADLAIWEIESPAELVYRMGFNPLHQRVWQGQTR